MGADVSHGMCVVCRPRDSLKNVIMLFWPPGTFGPDRYFNCQFTPKECPYGQAIGDRLGVPHLSTSEMRRASPSALILTELSGDRLSDDSVMSIVKDRISQLDCRRGFVMERFPRSLKQSEMLELMLSQDGDKFAVTVIEFHVPDDDLRRYMNDYWYHRPSGRLYHVTFKPPKSLGDATPCLENMLDDITGMPLEQRSEETAEGMLEQLKAYHEETEPIFTRYGSSTHRIEKTCYDRGPKCDEALWAQIQMALPRQS